VPYFICPNCQHRSIDDDGREGLTREAVGCHRCGFGYLVELLEDYYPPAGAGLLTCDRDGRVLSAGRGVFELTGYPEGDLMGRDLREALGLRREGDGAGSDPVGVVLEWGVRQLDVPMVMRHRAGIDKRVRADLFPAYDEDGGMLAALSPQRAA
jgi:PAS domain-containing protein